MCVHALVHACTFVTVCTRDVCRCVCSLGCCIKAWKNAVKRVVQLAPDELSQPWESLRVALVRHGQGRRKKEAAPVDFSAISGDPRPPHTHTHLCDVISGIRSLL